MPKYDDDDFDRDETPRNQNRGRDEDRYDDPPPKKKSPLPWILALVGGVLLLICGGAGLVIFMLISPVIQKARVTAARAETRSHLQMIALGALNYESMNDEWVHNRWSNTNTIELLSWRYEVFPFIEQENVYNLGNRSKAWNDPANATVLNTNIKTFKHHTESTPSNQTYFQAFSGPGAILDPKSPRKGRLGGQPRPLDAGNMRDGLSNTLFVVEASTKVTVIQPMDIPFPGGGVPTFGVESSSATFWGAFCDGSVRNLRKTSATPQGLNAWVCPNDGGMVPMD